MTRKIKHRRTADHDEFKSSELRILAPSPHCLTYSTTIDANNLVSEIMVCRKIVWIAVVASMLLTCSTRKSSRALNMYGYRNSPPNLPESKLAWHYMLSSFRDLIGRSIDSSVEYCGTSNGDPFEDRIVGGVEAKPHEFPWMSKIYHNNYFRCGAVLIADRYLLTAAHCLTTHINKTSLVPKLKRGNVVNYKVDDKSEFFVELGAHYIRDMIPNIVTRKIERIIVEPSYDLFTSGNIILQTNDIAIVEIAPVEFTVNILPICLPMDNARLPDNSQLVVAGWGSVLTEKLGKPSTKLPDALQKTVLTKISYNACKNNSFVGSHLTAANQLTSQEIFCMIGTNQDSCRGDSGGPVVLKSPLGYVVAGLVSWGLGCNQKNHPAAYTQVSSYMDFIRENTTKGKFLPHKPQLVISTRS